MFRWLVFGRRAVRGPLLLVLVPDFLVVTWRSRARLGVRRCSFFRGLGRSQVALKFFVSWCYTNTFWALQANAQAITLFQTISSHLPFEYQLVSYYSITACSQNVFPFLSTNFQIPSWISDSLLLSTHWSLSTVCSDSNFEVSSNCSQFLFLR